MSSRPIPKIDHDCRTLLYDWAAQSDYVIRTILVWRTRFKGKNHHHTTAMATARDGSVKHNTVTVVDD